MRISKKVFQRPLKEANIGQEQNYQKGLTFKFYYQYHMYGSQKCENYLKIPIGRGCNDLKNSTLLLGWAYCISD